MVFNRSTPMKSSLAGRRLQHGFSLIETMVVVTIATIAATSAAPGMQDLLDTRRLDGLATTLAADLQLARNEAIARNQPVRLSWSAAGACYVVHTGSVAQCSCGADGPAVCSGGAAQIRTLRWASADRVTVQANVGSILFDPQHGTASPSATWRITGADGRAIHHVVNLMGRVRSCAGQGSVPGYRAC
jgi:type IV fimbrial biogenesis protein FimT